MFRKPRCPSLEYPDTHTIINEEKIISEEEFNKFIDHNFHGYRAPEEQKKVHVERNKTTEAIDEKVDDEADSFIQRKHKIFELAKMETLKVYRYDH